MLLFALLLAPLADLQTADAPVGCRSCKQRGVLDCARHDEEMRALEPTVYCSAAAACPDCAGALRVDCPKCPGGPESAAMEARRAELAAWLAASGTHAAEAALGRPVLRIESPHLQLAAEIGALKDGKKKVDGHRFLHHLARDGERAAAMLAEQYGIERARDYRAAMRLWFWQDAQTHATLMREVLKSGSTGDFKLLGRKPVFSVCTSDEVFEDDYTRLLTLGTHNLVHMLQSNVWDEEWIGDQGGGWFDSGAAHWVEERIYGQVRHYCIEEAGSPPDWEGGVWRAAVRAWLAKRDDAVLPALVRKQTGEMMPEEHALAWSFYDWLATTRPQTPAPLLRALKQRTAARDALPEHAGIGLVEAEQEWRAWVEATYPAREKKPRD
jgi:hypothetical protein